MKMSSGQGEFVFLILGIMKLVHGDNCFDVDSVVEHEKYMEHQVFRKFWSPSLYDCASECLMSSACASFGFDKKTHTCFLNTNSSEAGNVVDRTGFIFSDIQQWPKSLSGRCNQVACPENTRCAVTRLGRSTCVSEFQGCGHPPGVRGATITYDGHYQGAVATYSCEQDFRVCHNNVTSTCQSSGAWESPSGLCGQYRWHNPVKNRYSFPCGSSSKFRLIIRGTLTDATRWDIGIMNHEDALFYSDFRINFGGIRMRTIMNTKLDGSWGQQVLADLSIVVGQESQVQITLQDGVYRLVIDSVSIHNFTERRSGAKPNNIIFNGDVSVSVMEWIS